jgi:tRNA(adenine34) deaminase
MCENLDNNFMSIAINQAKIAFDENEIPVGAVITLGDKIVGMGYNRREGGKSALLHAELIAIDEACRTLGGWRLWQCTIYVTLEPCPMCAGAIINSRIPRLVFGAYDKKSGACGSVINLFTSPFNHKPQVTGGYMEDECISILKKFFIKLRKTK